MVYLILYLGGDHTLSPPKDLKHIAKSTGCLPVSNSFGIFSFRLVIDIRKKHKMLFVKPGFHMIVTVGDASPRQAPGHIGNRCVK